MFLNADVTDSGEYICMARNEYGNVLQEFNVHVNCKWNHQWHTVVVYGSAS